MAGLSQPATLPGGSQYLDRIRRAGLTAFCPLPRGAPSAAMSRAPSLTLSRAVSASPVPRLWPLVRSVKTKQSAIMPPLSPTVLVMIFLMRMPAPRCGSYNPHNYCSSRPLADAPAPRRKPPLLPLLVRLGLLLRLGKQNTVSVHSSSCSTAGRGPSPVSLPTPLLILCRRSAAWSVPTSALSAAHPRPGGRLHQTASRCSRSSPAITSRAPSGIPPQPAPWACALPGYLRTAECGNGRAGSCH